MTAPTQLDDLDDDLAAVTRPPHIIDALHDLDAAAQLPEPEPEVPARRQPGVLVECFVEGADPYTVRITNRERIAYEKAAARHKEWPPMVTGQHFAMTFVTWHAARRAGLTAVTFDQWQNVLEDWEQLREEPADPTR